MLFIVWDAGHNPYGARNMISIRDPHEHARRRKPWNRAFSTTAVKDFEPTAQKRAYQLMRMLEEKAKANEPIDLLRWMQAFAYVLSPAAVQKIDTDL